MSTVTGVQFVARYSSVGWRGTRMLLSLLLPTVMMSSSVDESMEVLMRVICGFWRIVMNLFSELTNIQRRSRERPCGVRVAEGMEMPRHDLMG